MYIFALLLPLLFTACDTDEESPANTVLLGLAPQVLHFDASGGTKGVTADGELKYVRLYTIDQARVTQRRVIDLYDAETVTYPVTEDFGVCTVSITGPTTLEVSVTPYSQAAEIGLICTGLDDDGISLATNTLTVDIVR